MSVGLRISKQPAIVLDLVEHHYLIGQTTMPILGLIPARGGSKGVPRKNVRDLCGKPLIAWTIDAALSSGKIDRLIVSTDDEEIAQVGSAYGAEVPFLRPGYLAEDHTPGIDVVHHALQQLPEFDTVVLLQPTSPLRSAGDISAAVDLYTRSGRRNCIGVAESTDSPYWSYFLDDLSLQPVMREQAPSRRQDLRSTVTINGAIYVANVRQLLAHGSFLVPNMVPYVMPRERSIDIDTEFDFQLCEFLIRNTLS